MRRFNVWLFAVVSLTLAVPAVVRSQTVHDVGQWTAFFTQGDFGSDTSPIRYWFDGQVRLLEDTDGFNQSLVRPGLGWALSENLTAWAGYGWIHTEPVTGDPFEEHRIWQQLTWSHKHEDWTLALRPRLEQRFLETGDDLGWRFRQLVRVQHDLPNLPRLTLVAWDEIFFHLGDTDWGARSGFDQNRAFVGFGWKHHPEARLRTEIGYLNQTIHLPTGDDRINHILSVSFVF